MAEGNEPEDVKKRLDFTAEAEEQLLEVYLRVKPLSSAGAPHKGSCIKITSDTAVEVTAPNDSFAFRNNSRRRRPATYKFSFSRVLPASVSQSAVHHHTTEPAVVRLVNDARSSLIFSFGVTNSGKTFTIEGTCEEAGILPRSLDVLFNSLGQQLSDEAAVKPDKFNDIIELDEDQTLAERTLLDQLCRSSLSESSKASADCTAASLTTSRTPSGPSAESTMSSESSFGELVEVLQQRARDSTRFEVLDTESKFSVFVSYAEIYNECVYDLLEVPPRKRRERRALPLSEDKSGSVYVKYLKKVNVASADDALRAVALGKRNRRIASTFFNEQSSRSHCMFTVYLIQRQHGKNTMSQMSFVDLAGSERTAKTTTDNVRVKESGNINKSLMTLKNCISAVRFNNNHRNNQRIIPYRESKLTRLLQNYFVKRGSITMIVNISPDPSSFDETLHVLRFSAVASQVRIVAPVHEVTEVDESLVSDDEEFETLLEEIESLREENALLKRDISRGETEMHFQEMRLREEIVAENMKKLTEMDDYYRESVDSERVRMEEAEQRRMSLLEKMMTESQQSEVSSLKDEVDQLKQQILTSNTEADQLKQQILTANAEAEQLKQQIVTSNAEADQLKQQILTANAEADQLKQQILTANAEADQLKQQIVTANAEMVELASMEEQSAEKEMENKVLTSQVSELEEQLRNSQEAEQQLVEARKSEQKTREALHDMTARLEEMEKEIEENKERLDTESRETEMTLEVLRRRVKEQADEIERFQGQIKEQADEMERLQGQIKEQKDGQEQEVTVDEETDSHDVASSLVVHDVETSIHTEIDVTPKAAKKKRRGRKRKSDENKPVEQLNKIQKREQSIPKKRQQSTSRSQTAKKKVVQQLILIEEGDSPPASKTTTKMGKMVELLDTVFSPLTGKVRDVLSPTKYVNCEKEELRGKSGKKVKGVLSKSQISWPVAFQSTTNKTLQGPSTGRVLRSKLRKK